MEGLQGVSVVAALASPVRRSKLSLKFLQKKETKRVLDFSEPRTSEPLKPEASCDQVVPGPSQCPDSPGLFLPCEKKENLVPFVGLNNLGNTCYLNSVLQVLYYCPRLRYGMKQLYKLSKRKDESREGSDDSKESGVCAEALPAPMELLQSFNSLIASMEQLQASFLLNSISEGELATPPRQILHTLRQLNPMYEGCLQHDAQEVLQCILGYIQEACDSIRKEQDLENDKIEIKVEDGVRLGSSSSEPEPNPPLEDDSQVGGKRKSDTEVGNAKKKTKSVKYNKSDAEGEIRSGPLTRSKSRSSINIMTNGTQDTSGAGEEEEESDSEGKGKKSSKGVDGKRKKSKLSWLRPSGKQPSIFSKFRRVGKISCTTVKPRNEAEKKKEEKKKEEHGDEKEEEKKKEEEHGDEKEEEKKKEEHGDEKEEEKKKEEHGDEKEEEKKKEEHGDEKEEEKKKEEHGDEKEEEKKAANAPEGLDLMETLFQGQLVLRTRCLECESFTERREDFQDISVPVLDEQPSSPEDLSEVSPDPKPQVKTLTWAIGQFASVERIVGEDKYFCETCHHYSEAERSLLFDRSPEVITIHLKRFSANSLEFAGLCKVNTPLQTPLTLSLEEWSRPSSAKGPCYQLFAVVMHSGVTISSGHYTTFIRMSDLRDVKLSLQDNHESDGEQEKKDSKEGVVDYDDGEVSFSLKARKSVSLARSKPGAKKLSEAGGGLLGGQRSSSSYSEGLTEGSKRRKTLNSHNDEVGVRREAGGAEDASMEASSQLIGYEGKWLLFDDSEVRLFEEDDFLRACSPDASSASTPYLLFYRRTPDPGPGH